MVALVPAPHVPQGWIVPRAGQSTLRALMEPGGYRDGEVRRFVDLADVDMPPLAPHALDLGLDLLVYARGRQLHVVRGLRGGAPATSVVKLGWRTTLHAVALVDGVVYAGGQGGPDMLGFFDAMGSTPWRRLPIPEHVTTFGKGIDGFAVHEGMLIAVDDIVLPRYLIRYDVRDPRAPVLVEARHLPHHSSAERIRAVASDGGAMVLLSSSANRGRMSQHVALYDLASLEERAVLHTEQRGSWRRAGARPIDFTSVALTGDTLWIAARADGIGVLDVQEWRAHRGTRATIPLERVRFVPVAAGNVVRVVPAAPRTALAVIGGRRPDTVAVCIDPAG
jgi:hypothetical protein